MSLALVAAIPNGTYVEYMPWLEPLYSERIVLEKQSWMVPDTLPLAEEVVVPLRAGQQVGWRLVA